MVLTPPWSFQDNLYFTSRDIRVIVESDQEAFSMGLISISIHFAVIRGLSNVKKAGKYYSIRIISYFA